MKKRDGDSRNAEGGSGGGGSELNKKKHKKRLGGKGLSLEAFVGANRIKPIVTASQIRKQREVYQNSKKVNKYRKTLKQLAEEGHEFRPRVPLSIDAEIPGQEPLDSPTNPKNSRPSSSTKDNQPHSSTEPTEPETDSPEKKTKKKPKPKPTKPVSQLERTRHEYEKKKQEEDAVRKEKQALFEEQQAAREQAKHQRKEVQKKFRKTTGKGQPVMKHRMEHLLESIQRDMKR